jgi:hypothetical protein
MFKDGACVTRLFDKRLSLPVRPSKTNTLAGPDIGVCGYEDESVSIDYYSPVKQVLSSFAHLQFNDPTHSLFIDVPVNGRVNDKIWSSNSDVRKLKPFVNFKYPVMLLVIGNVDTCIVFSRHRKPKAEYNTRPGTLFILSGHQFFSTSSDTKGLHFHVTQLQRLLGNFTMMMFFTATHCHAPNKYKHKISPANSPIRRRRKSNADIYEEHIESLMNTSLTVSDEERIEQIKLVLKS